MKDEVTALAKAPDPATPLAMLLANPKLLETVDVDKLERLFDLERELRADVSRQAFAAAKVGCQAAMTGVPKRGWNDSTKSAHALLRDIEAMLLPVMHAHGFTQSIGQGGASHESLLRIELTVTHEAGHSETVWEEAPCDDKGPKGNPTKSKLHGVKSTRTYVARDLIEAYWRIPLGEALDDDGNTGSGLSLPITPTEVVELRASLETTGRTEQQLAAALGAETLDTLPSGKLAQARSLLASTGGS